ncbi:solute carrier family 66 member 3 isoform X4 [Choloepus didactylus]|uniref:solute carrier family 66 member 3 isoform X4 n=1 Tax=Choloepus didactylus TaxID=27675 RepID=UPI0018A0039B|nr:solute carrier family 66 member 3 isoform X4 [Choloepus didactylus]
MLFGSEHPTRTACAPLASRGSASACPGPSRGRSPRPRAGAELRGPGGGARRGGEGGRPGGGARKAPARRAMEARLLRFCHWSTLGVCAALKLPQLSALLAARGARGLSLPSLLLELAGFLVFLRYQCYYGYPLLTYLEVPILIAQDVILLLCVFHFNGNVKQAAPYLAVFFSSWFVLTLQKWIIDLAMNLCTFISAASKFAQLQYLWKTRDSGAVSALTWSLASYTCARNLGNF